MATLVSFAIFCQLDGWHSNVHDYFRYTNGGLAAFWRGLAPRSWRLCGAVFILGETQTHLSNIFNRFGLLE